MLGAVLAVVDPGFAFGAQEPAPVVPPVASLAGAPGTLKPVAEGRVTGISAPARIHLDTGAILTPALLLPGDPAPLEALIGKQVRAFWTGPETDRHRRQPALLELQDTGQWWQGLMVATGQARLWTDRDDAPGVAVLQPLEDTARLTCTGFWTTAAWHPREATAPSTLPAGHFALLTGTVRSASLRQKSLYLDFGADWRSDTTMVIAPSLLKTLPKAQRTPDFWINRRVEARGWIRQGAGPRLDPFTANALRPDPPRFNPCVEQSGPRL